jgi:phosphoglycolate phosphatase-like HAD superfamily hydrolase
MFVGDSDADLIGAQRARVCFAGIAPDAERRARLRLLDPQAALFDSPAELAAAFGMAAAMPGSD